MAGNRPARERFDFSLDARQVAAVILGSLGGLALAFFLGHAIGQRVADRPAVAVRAPASPAPTDALAVLDQAPRPDGGEVPAQFSFHETLTSAKPPQDRLPPAPRAPAAPALEPKGAPLASPAPADAKAAPPPAAGQAPPGSAPVAAGPVPDGKGTGSKPAPAKAAEAKPAPPQATPPRSASLAPPKGAPAPAAPSLRPASAAKGAWVVQVGSTQDRVEADRIAARFATRGARVVVADVPGKGRWYRVRLGSFETREAADRYLRDMERSTGAKGFVATAN
jgi:cell division septation protein DedD